MRRLRLVLPLLAALAVLVPWWAARRDTANPAPAAAALNLAREQGRAIAALRADLAAYRAETARRRDAATHPRERPAAADGAVRDAATPPRGPVSRRWCSNTTASAAAAKESSTSSNAASARSLKMPGGTPIARRRSRRSARA